MDRHSTSAARVTLECGETLRLLSDVGFGAGRSASVGQEALMLSKIYGPGNTGVPEITHSHHKNHIAAGFVAVSLAFG